MQVFKSSHTEALNCSFFNFNPNIDILRDDLIHPLVSGNKWRKLKYFIEEIRNKTSATIATFGGAYSNHLVAAAFAGKHFNIPTHGFVRGDETRDLNLYEKTCIENGMTLQHVSRATYRDKEKLFNDYADSHPGAIFLDEGGDHELALQGCADILDELVNQYDYIILAAGTGTTMEGLVKGVFERGLETQVMGISSLKNNLEIDGRLQRYPQRHWKVFHDYHRGRYASMDDELITFIHEFHKETGIKLEPVYTGKMMMATMDLYRTGFLSPKDKILLIHTGGLLAFPGNPL